VWSPLVENQATMRKGKAAPMKNKPANTPRHQKDNKDVKRQAVPVPPTAIELSEEDLKKVSGGVSFSYAEIKYQYTQQK
jgi:mersacidin/lichenicidin family type 2 lantibiotic